MGNFWNIFGEFSEEISGKNAEGISKELSLRISEGITDRKAGGFSWGNHAIICGCISCFISGKNSKSIPVGRFGGTSEGIPVKICERITGCFFFGQTS